jgi:hypothetical protein
MPRDFAARLLVLLAIGFSFTVLTRGAAAQSALPVLAWEQFTPGIGGSDVARHVGLDDCGNSPHGFLRWVRTWKAVDGSSAEIVDMAVTPSGAVHVLAASYSPTGPSNVILKWDSSGNLAWHSLEGDPNDPSDYPYSIGVDATGNVYATYQTGQGTDADVVTLSRGPDGAARWADRFDGPLAGADQTNELAVDDGGVYVAGTTQGLQGVDGLLIRYDGAGQREWFRTFAPSAIIGGVAADPRGGVFVTATITSFVPPKLLWSTRRYDADGNLTWEHEYDAGLTTSIVTWDLVADRTGRVTVVGQTLNLGSGVELPVVKSYDPHGNPDWEATLTHIVNPTPVRAAGDPGGNVYVMGAASGSGRDYRVTAFSPQGALLWERQVDGAGNDDFPFDITADGAGSAYVTGAGFNNLQRRTFYTVKLDNTGDTVAEMDVFDANPLYLLGARLPVADAAAIAPHLGSANLTASGRRPDAIAADGVSLLLLRIEVPATSEGSVHFQVSGNGSLWNLDAQGLLDTSVEGGKRDSSPEPREVIVPAYTIGNKRYAFALYRAPRDFDTGGSGTFLFREVTVSACVPGRLGAGYDHTSTKTIRIVRPLVLFLHGTFSSPDTWEHFVTYRHGSNERDGWSTIGPKPFYCGTLSFASVDHGGGFASDSANELLPQIPATIYRWSQRLNFAATQADLVAHSYGGVVARVAANIQSDSVLGEDAATNFRALTNWGHGPIHKLITIGTTHRGAAVVNHIALLNRQTGGKVARWLSDTRVAINQGALEDQWVAYGAQRLLKRATPFPGHAIVGLCNYERGTDEQHLFELMRVADFPANGPYARAFNGAISTTQGYQRLVNYVFNMNYTQFADPDTGLQPGYDLVVGARSARGGMTGLAYSALKGSSSASLGHTAQPRGTYLELSDRVEQLLKFGTTSIYFRPFPPFEAAYSLAELQMQSLASPSDLYVTDSGSVTAAATPPVLTTNVTGSVVTAGQSFSASVSWPGKKIRSALFLYPVPGSLGSNRVEGLAPSIAIPVAVGLPASFRLFVLVEATDRTVGEVSVELQVQDNTSFLGLASDPGSIRLESGYPVSLRIYGRLPDGSWRSLTGAARTHLTSTDPAVAMVSDDGTVRPMGMGTAAIEVTVEGAGSLSVPVTVTKAPPSPPAAPTELNAQVLSGKARLTWLDNSSNEDGFQVLRQEPGGGYSVVGQVGAGSTALDDEAVVPLGSYLYRVRAFNSGGLSDLSNIASATLPASAGGRLVVPKSINFGKLRVGSYKEKVLKIKNADGRAPLALRLGPITGGAYTISESGARTLGPGKTLLLKVRFAPAQPGAASGLLAIASSDARKPSATVSLKGTGR